MVSVTVIYRMKLPTKTANAKELYVEILLPHGDVGGPLKEGLSKRNCSESLQQTGGFRAFVNIAGDSVE
jgi:hypothetical protein